MNLTSKNKIPTLRNPMQNGIYQFYAVCLKELGHIIQDF